MKNSTKKTGLSPLQLALIIGASVIAAVGILILIMQICKKKANKKAADACCCEGDLEDIEAWDIDEDILAELGLDEDETEEICGCADCACTCESDETEDAADEQ